VVFTVNLLAGRAGAGGAVDRPQHRTYVVKAGDTLWGIASDVVGPQGDPRPLVDRLGRTNHVESGLIHVGDVLVVPAP
jgi:nucleoid-associated protein YgaU